MAEADHPHHSPSSLRARIAARYGMDSDEVFDILKATAFKVKDAVASDAQLTALLIVAEQYRLNPFVRELFAFPDKQNGIVPVVSLDGWTRIINEHPGFDGISFAYADTLIQLPGLKKPLHEWTDCVIYRKDRSHPIIVREYAEECYREPFTGRSQYGSRDNYTVEGPWQSHPRRMLRHKAQIQCARIAFGFAGIYDQDEAERMIDMGAAEEVGAGQQHTGFMPRALPDEPSPQANFTAAPARAAEPVAAAQKPAQPAQQPADDPLAPAEPAAPQPAKEAPREPVQADFTAAPNRFAPPAPKEQAAARPRAARASKPAPEQPAGNAPNSQSLDFEDGSQAAAEERAPAEPVPQNMLNVLTRKMEIGGKNEVDMKARFGHGLDGVTKANFGELQSWASGR